MKTPPNNKALESASGDADYNQLANWFNQKNDIGRARDALFHIDAGCARDEWVRAGMAAKSAGLDFDEFHNWSASAGNYAGENECRTAWKSFAESGAVTPATLFGMAFAQGWKDPSKSRTKGSNTTRPSASISKPAPSPQTPVKHAANTDMVKAWGHGVAATLADAYVHRKQGVPDGLKVYPASAPPLSIRRQNVAGYLMVPCWDGDKLQTLQFIPPGKGDKLNFKGASFGDGFFTVGDIASAKKIFIVEGVGTAWAVTKADPASAAVVCFGAGRMARVAAVLRNKYSVLKGGSK